MPDQSLNLPDVLIKPLVENALREDLGDGGDLTSQACIDQTTQMRAVMNARKPGYLSGSQLAVCSFAMIDPEIKIEHHKYDGDQLAAGDKVMTITGPARSILTAERVALNFMGHLSGIATATGELVAQTKGTNAKIVCTRKTTPGLRVVEKYAVRCGGGYNHRFGLYDAVMIKDNHINAAGGISEALKAVKAHVGHTVKIEIEVDTLEQLGEVLTQGADIILLDNMSPDELAKAVALNRAQGESKAILEASGNVTAKTVSAIAKSGIDYISSGWITHSAPVLDLGLDVA